jgi:hypothetical protein
MIEIITSLLDLNLDQWLNSSVTLMIKKNIKKREVS